MDSFEVLTGPWSNVWCYVIPVVNFQAKYGMGNHFTFSIMDIILLNIYNLCLFVNVKLLLSIYLKLKLQKDAESEFNFSKSIVEKQFVLIYILLVPN